MLTHRIAVLALGGALVAARPLPAQVITFDFTSTPIGTTTPFSATAGGLTAAFSSLDGNVFTVAGGSFRILSGNLLRDADPALHTLLIAFSHPLSRFSTRFSLNYTSGGGTLGLVASHGGSLVGSASTTGLVPIGFTYPEGVLRYTGYEFDQVAIQSAAQDFAIDHMEVELSTVPEPASLGLLGLGATALFGLQAVRHRRRR